MTMDMLQKCLQVLQDSQGKIEKKLDDNVKQTKKNTDKIKAPTKQAVYMMTEKGLPRTNRVQNNTTLQASRNKQHKKTKWSS